MSKNNEPGVAGKVPTDDALPTNRQVTVTVDGHEQRVPRGDWVVAKFKEAVGVKAGMVLDQVINGEFKELADNATITIEGGEVFVSHVPQGGSS